MHQEVSCATEYNFMRRTPSGKEEKENLQSMLEDKTKQLQEIKQKINRSASALEVLEVKVETQRLEESFKKTVKKKKKKKNIRKTSMSKKTNVTSNSCNTRRVSAVTTRAFKLLN